MIAPRSFSTRSRIVLAVLALALVPGVGRAQPSSSLGEPLVVVNVAGVDRVLEDVRWVFESVDRPDLVDGIATVLTTVNDLKGIDRTRPLGALAFAVPTGNRQPLVVGYVPVENLDDLMASLTVGPIRPERVAGTEGRWRLAGPDNPDNAVFLEARNGYAWIVRDPKLFEVTYPDPVTTNRELTDRYDVAVSFNVAAIPAGLRFLASAAMRNAAPKVEGDPADPRTKLQQRALDGALKFADQFLGEGRDVVFGWNFDKAAKQIVAEFAVNAQPDTPLAKSFEETFTAAPSRFTNGLAKDAPFTTAISWKMSDTTRAFLSDALVLARKQAHEEAGGDAEPASREVLNTAFDVFAATVAAGHVDLFLQATGSPPGGMTIVGGFGIEQGEKLNALYDQVDIDVFEAEGEFTRNAAAHGGVTLHRFVPNAADVEDRRLFGGSPTVHVGNDARTFWFAISGKQGLATLERSIDAAANAEPTIRTDDGRPLVSLDAGAATMMLLSDDRDPDFEALAQKAFLAGGDRVGFSLGPKPNGVAVKFQLGEGWVRLLGLSAAKGFDEAN